jgi:hypothetical protein
MTYHEEAYLIVINARNLMERAFALYHAASRKEDCSYYVQCFTQELNDTEKAFDAFAQSTTNKESI